MADFVLTGREQASLAIGRPIDICLQSPAASMFRSGQAVCAALYEVEETERSGLQLSWLGKGGLRTDCLAMA
jgi:hypothetical protein